MCSVPEKQLVCLGSYFKFLKYCLIIINNLIQCQGEAEFPSARSLRCGRRAKGIYRGPAVLSFVFFWLRFLFWAEGEGEEEEPFQRRIKIKLGG